MATLRRALARVGPETWAVVGVLVLYVLPLLTTRYFPGLDLPWHVAGISVMHRHDEAAIARDFLGYFEVDVQFSSYLTLYVAVDALAFVTGDVVIATQLLVAIYVVLFVLAVRRLLRAFGGSGVLAVLAAPAAYSTVLEFGFLAYALAYPITFFLWALVRELVGGLGRVDWWRVGGVLAMTVVLAFTHPFAAAVALGGAVLIALVSARRDQLRRLWVCAGALVLGAVPIAVAIASVPRSTDWMPPIIRNASLWQKLTNQPFTSVTDSITSAPGWLFGFQAPVVRVLLFFAVIGAAVWVAAVNGRRERAGARWYQRFGLELVAGAVVIGYLITPFAFHWPRAWYFAQPRWLPVLLVVGLLCVRARPGGDRTLRALAPPVAVAALAGVLLCASFWSFAAECADFRIMVEASAPRAKTLGLIENPADGNRTAPAPWRHFTAYLMAEKGGYASNMPLSYTGRASVGSLVPVRVKPRHQRGPLPRANPIIALFSFDWNEHGVHWDQFLIRDANPEKPYDYFREHANEVELVARSGRWRLYRRKGAEAGATARGNNATLPSAPSK